MPRADRAALLAAMCRPATSVPLPVEHGKTQPLQVAPRPAPHILRSRPAQVASSLLITTDGVIVKLDLVTVAATHQLVGTPLLVDVIGQELREVCHGNTLALSRQRHDRRVLHRKATQLLESLAINHQAVSLPEIGVVAEHLGQGQEEPLLELDRGVPVCDRLDAPARIDSVEERLHVRLHHTLAGALHDLLETTRQLLADVAPARTDVTVQHSHRLGEGKRADQRATMTVLLPSDTRVEHKALALRHLVEHLDSVNVIPKIPQRDVAVHPRLAKVQNLKALALPVEGGVEVNRHLNLRVGRGLKHQQSQGGRGALKPVHDVDGRVQEERAVFVHVDAVLISTHAELHSGNPRLAQSLHELADLDVRELFALIGVRLQQSERLRRDESRHDDATVVLVEVGLDDLHSSGFTHQSILSSMRVATLALVLRYTFWTVA